MKYSDRLREYEKRKRILQETCSTYEEYEQKLKEIIKELRI